MIPAFEKNQVDDIVNAFNKYGAVVIKGMGVNPQLRKEITEVLNQIEPSVDKSFDMGQKCLDKWVELIL